MMESREEVDGWLVYDGIVDYKGRKVDKRYIGGWKVVLFIFGLLFILCFIDLVEMF